MPRPSRYALPAGSVMVTNNHMRHVSAIGRAARLTGRPKFVILLMAALPMPLLTASCSTPDPKALVKVTDVETYWVLDPSRTGKIPLAPAVRFRVENISNETLISVDATAAFRIEGSPDPWGSGFFRLTEGRKTLAPGAKVLVTMSSDARYSLEGDPEKVFSNSGFKPVNTRYFIRVGSSPWVDFGGEVVQNVIGSKDARAINQSK